MPIYHIGFSVCDTFFLSPKVLTSVPTVVFSSSVSWIGTDYDMPYAGHVAMSQEEMKR